MHRRLSQRNEMRETDLDPILAFPRVAFIHQIENFAENSILLPFAKFNTMQHRAMRQYHEPALIF